VISHGAPLNGIMLWPTKTIPMMMTRNQSR
jgi:hypothetical protein